MEKNQQQGYPLAPANGYPRSDTELASNNANELKKKKRIKLAIYIAVFAVFQVIVITAFGLTVMKVKSPKVRLSNIRFQTLETRASTSSPSFDISLITQVRIKNTNFGTYKFESTSASFKYQGTTVGEVVIPKGKAGFKSTKKMDVTVNLDSNALASTINLGNELSSGILTLNSSAKMKGKVTLMLIMKKNKSADMNCTMTFDVSQKTVRSLQCK